MTITVMPKVIIITSRVTVADMTTAPNQMFPLVSEWEPA